MVAHMCPAPGKAGILMMRPDRGQDHRCYANTRAAGVCRRGKPASRAKQRSTASPRVLGFVRNGLCGCLRRFPSAAAFLKYYQIFRRCSHQDYVPRTLPLLLCILSMCWFAAFTFRPQTKKSCLTSNTTPH